MSRCAHCGNELDVGRFCTNCGAAVAETGEDRAAAAPPTPPPPSRSERGRARPARAPVVAAWLLGLALLGGVGAVGAWLLFSGSERSSSVADASSDREVTAGPERTEPAEAAGTAGPDRSPSAPPRSRWSKPRDLAGRTDVTAPAPAAASRDTDGNVVRYVAQHLVDSEPTTAWRMRGDGTGATITFRFDRPVLLREVGLINGYAKTGSSRRGAIDWYPSNRRVSSVRWAFGGGRVVDQRLVSTRRMQTTRVGRVRTREVTLRMLQVTPPGTGSTARDYTALSGVRLVGSTR